MAHGIVTGSRLRRRTLGFQGLVTRIREDGAAVRDATPQPEPAPEPFSNTLALLQERELETGPAAAVPLAPRADQAPMVDIDLENGFVLTPQGFVQKPGAKPDPVTVFDRDTGRLTPLSGLQRLLPGRVGDPGGLLAALQHDVDRVLGRDREVEAEVLVPFGPEQFREAAREPAVPFDLLGVRRREVEARPPVTFEQAAAQVEPIPLQPHVFVKDGTEIPEELVGPGLRFSRQDLEAKGFELTRETELDPPTRGGRELFWDPVDGWTTQKPLPGILGDISVTIRRAAVTPLFEIGGVPISATDIVGILLIGYGAVQGGRALWPSVRNLPSATVDKALNVRVGQAQVDKWVATQGRLPPETQSRLGRWLVGNRTWLVERATKNLVARQAAARAAGQTPQQAAARAASDTVTDAAAKVRTDLGGALPVRAAPGVVPAAQPAPSTGNVVSIQQVISGIIGQAGTAEAARGVVAQAPAGPVGGVPPDPAVAARIAELQAELQRAQATESPAQQLSATSETARLTREVETLQEQVAPTLRQVPFEPEAGVQAGAFGVPDVDVRPVGRGEVTQVSLDDQLKLQQARDAALVPDVEAKLFELGQELAVKQELLKDNPFNNFVIKFQTTPSKLDPVKGRRREFKPTREVQITSLLDSAGRFPETVTPKQAQALLGRSDPLPKTALTKSGRVTRQVALDEVVRQLARFEQGAELTADDVAEMIERFAADKAEILALEDRVTDLEETLARLDAGVVAPTAAPLPASVSAPPPPDEVGLIETRPQAIPAPETLVAEDAAVAQVDSTIPPVPPEPPRSFLDFGDAQFDRYKGITPNPIPGTRPFSERIRGFGKELEKAFTDEFARLNALGWQSEVDAALTRAASGRSQEIYRQAFNQIRNALGKDGSLVEFVDDYLVLRHQLEVMRATGRKTFRVTKGGRTQTFTPKQIQGLFVSMKNQLGAEAYARVKQAASVVPSVYHDILRGTQELTTEQIEGLIKKFPWYNPILFEDEFSTGATILNPNSKLQSRQIKRLTEFSSDKQLTTPLTALANTINRRVAANARNDARGSIAQDAIANPKAAGGDVELVEAKPSGASFDFFDKGVRRWAKLGPGSEWIAKDIELLTSQPKNIINRFARAINSIPRQFFTTYNPGFVATNTLFDGLTAFFSEGIGPRGFTKALLKNVKAMFTENETVNRFRLAGGDVGGFFRAREAAAAEEFITRSKTGVITLKNPKDLKRFANPFVLVREFGHAGENAARVAAYEKGIKDGLPDREAGLRGRRVTVDFSRAGTASRVINDWFLFFNAGLQGFMLPGRRIASDPRSLARLAVLLAGYLGLTLYNTSYDEYQDVSLSDRKGWLIIMVPSDEYDNRGRKVPHYIRVLPLREFAVVTGAIELVVGGLKTDAPEAYRTLAQEFQAWYPVWSPLSMITQTGGVELPTQALQTIQQIINNHDTFRDRDIVDEDMKLLPAAQQYDQFTDSLAIKIGQAINVSPKQLDFFVSNMFGSLGRDALRALDVVIGQIDRDLVDERIAALVDDLRSIATQVPPSQIEVARETFLEGLSIEDRDLVLSMERIPTEKIPFVDSFFRRFFKEHGGQVERTVREKIQETRPFSDLPAEALAQLQNDAVDNAENLLASKISKEQYDSQRTRYRAVFSGGSTAEWRQAQLEGAVSRAELDEALPEAYRRSEEFQAVSAYQQIRAELISQQGGVFDAAAWTFIETATMQELRQFYSETAVTYALTHKDDWIDRLPEPARSLERRRALQLDSGAWWDGYRDPGLGGLPSGQGAASTADPFGGRLSRGETGGAPSGRRLDNTRSLLEGRLGR